MTVHRVSDPAVKAAFLSYPQEISDALRDLRETILDVADAVKSIGVIEETLKWGQPSYRPIGRRVGTTIRIGPMPNSRTEYALFVHCQTSLASDFEELYPGVFKVLDNRAVVFSIGDVLPDLPLRHCIALALTYHLRDGVDIAKLETVEA